MHHTTDDTAVRIKAYPVLYPCVSCAVLKYGRRVDHVVRLCVRAIGVARPLIRSRADVGQTK